MKRLLSGLAGILLATSLHAKAPIDIQGLSEPMMGTHQVRVVSSDPAVDGIECALGTEHPKQYKLGEWTDVFFGSIPSPQDFRCTAFAEGKAKYRFSRGVNLGGLARDIWFENLRTGEHVSGMQEVAVCVKSRETPQRVQASIRDEHADLARADRCNDGSLRYTGRINIPNEETILSATGSFEQDSVETTAQVNAEPNTFFDETSVVSVGLSLQARSPRGDLIKLSEQGLKVYEDNYQVDLVAIKGYDSSPLRLAIVVDLSASTGGDLYAEQALRKVLYKEIKEGDLIRADAISAHAATIQDWTNDIDLVETSLQREEGGAHGSATHINDTLMDVLYSIQSDNHEGLSAIIMVTDGRDNGSKSTIDDVKRYADSLGVKIYPVAVEIPIGTAHTLSDIDYLQAIASDAHVPIIQLTENSLIASKTRSHIENNISQLREQYERISADPAQLHDTEGNPAPQMVVQAFLNDIANQREALQSRLRALNENSAKSNAKATEEFEMVGRGIIENLRSSYLITYRSKATYPGYHTITVEFPDARIDCRKGFYSR